VLYVGRLAREKHLPALRGIAAHPALALTLVGGGQHEAEIRHALPGAAFLGHLLGDDLADAYAAADLFAFPGPSETFAQVVLEAMASGLPVIAAARGGPSSLVTEGHSGHLVAVDDVEAFTARAAALAADPARRAAMSATARAFALRQSWSAVMARLEGYYAEAQALRRRLNRLRARR
jgi:phosphatidylinositol alpha 1,6-mannosyltransferase